MTIDQKIQKEKKNIDRFSKHPALQKAEKHFYLQMFRENLKRLRENGTIQQRN